MLLLLDANGALLLAAVGGLLICAEFCLPGWVAPGVLGGVCLVCGAYRLALLEASGTVALGLAATVIVALAGGYGLVPAWLGAAGILGVPMLCRALVPGAVHWAAAGAATLAPVVAFGLLRVAARAVSNKTLIQ